MNLRLLSFRALVRQQSQTIQASTGRVWDLTVGSITRALVEANASVALWMQWLIVLVSQQSRLATSSGTDVDSFVNDFGAARLPATYSTGQAVLSRATPGLAAIIPSGTTVLTADRSQSYVVTSGPWTLASAATYIVVPVVAVTAGAAGNIQAGALSLLASAVPGVDTVVNLAPFAGGLDAETDIALRARFPLFVDSRSRGTRSAIANAIVSYRQGLAYAVLDGVEPSGNVRPAFFTVVVDDGTGFPPPSLLAGIQTAVEAVRPLGTAFAVLPPVVVPAVVSMTLQAAPGYAKADLIGPVAASILAYINALPISMPLDYARLGWLALNVPGVFNATAIVLNGQAADIGGLPVQVVRSTSPQIVVS